MSDELPAPLVPAEVDLRDFGFMPLDVRTLLTSTLWIKAKKDPRVAHAAMSLWCESWHQVPCASLPDDDEVLADLARCDEKEWKRVKDRALAHFVKCSDGRLYHRTVAAKAVESWKSKVAQRERTKKATEARQAKQREQTGPPDDQRDDERHDQRHDQRDVQRDDSRDVHQGTVKGEGIDTPIAPKGAACPGFESFWTAWPKSPRKGGKAECERVWRQKALEAQADAIVAHVTALAGSDGWTKQGGEYVPAPVVYLRGKRWDGAELSGIAAGRADDIFAGAH